VLSVADWKTRTEYVLRVGQHLGKYRITKRLADGGFARVYGAYDTVAGVPVAIKIPHEDLLTREALDDFRREVRITAKLDHPNILPVKDAGHIDGRFVIIYPLGEESLADRMTRRMSVRTVLDLTGQMLEAVSFAHEHRVMHCDIKPENFIIFAGDRVRLADFGIAKVAARTLAASGSGTIGYVAPEQAMGKPSLRSDVFSLGLIIYRMLSGQLPEWPFHWPPPGFDRVKKNVHREMVSFIERSLQLDSSKRFADATRMLAAFKKIRPKALRKAAAKRSVPRRGKSKTADWRTVRHRQFSRRYRTQLEVRHECAKCHSPIAEVMQACPWCGVKIAKWRDEVRFHKRCPRCRRGVKSDWRFCAWCYGGAISTASELRYDDKRYVRRCGNQRCGGWLMPFSRYCPWCRAKVTHAWKLEGEAGRCPRCAWGVLPEFWDHCPWCARNLRRA
jgi:serine/threonine-protein kinase